MTQLPPSPSSASSSTSGGYVRRSSQPSTEGSTKLVIIGLVLAAAAAIGFVVDRQRMETRQQREAFTVHLLTKSVRSGDKLQKDDLKAIKVPADFADSFQKLGYVTQNEVELRLREQRPFQRAATQGQIVTHALFDGTTAASVDRLINDGYVAATLSIRVLPPILQPEMRVDIVAPFSMAGKITVMPVIQNVRVISVGPYTAPEEGAGRGAARTSGYQTITIEIPPTDASKLSLVEKAAGGPFELQIRRPGDLRLDFPGVNEQVLQSIQRGTAGKPGAIDQLPSSSR